MRRSVFVAGVALACLTLAGCGQRIRFDEAAVEVVEVGSGAGVQEQEISTGRYWAPPLSYRYIVKFPTTIQTYTWEDRDPNKQECFSYINADRVEASQCLSMNVRINAPDADNIVRKYKGSITRGGGDGYVLDDVVNGPITRELKQAFVTYGVKYTSAQLYADGGRALLTDVRKDVAPKFEKDGIVIQDLLASGAPGLPDDIVQTIKASLLATENARQKDAELAATVAEGKKTVAQAEADAKARELAAQSIRSNPEILKLEEIRERGRSLCPINATTCVIGASALTNVEN